MACSIFAADRFRDTGLAGITGRGKRIRTSGPCVPNAVLYQAELFPDAFSAEPAMFCQLSKSNSRTSYCKSDVL